ncbi:MAG: Dyp-type peroxidase [Vulcanimicrobiaceae bacterium]
MRLGDPESGRAFVRKLAPYVTYAADYARQTSWLAVAFTFEGLRALGLPAASLATFAIAFREGMAARAPRFGDRGESDPANWEQPYGRDQLHVALALMAATETRLREELEFARRSAAELPGITVLRREDFAQVPGGRTHLGFRDGISFPTIEGNGPNPLPDGTRPIAAGEFVLGYPGESGRPLALPQPEILGRNGSFVGLRKLHVRVAAFRRFLRENATPALAEELLAAKMVGRWRSGAPLALSPERDDPEAADDPLRVNAFGYADDSSGLRCPLGAHVRRMNPRDAPLAVLSDVNLHRIVRHGATYGPPLPEGRLDDDGIERGIFFIFISARAPETFEFLKSEWIESGNFVGLGAQKDPIAGANDGKGIFTIPLRPIRKRLHGLDRFTITRGGAYGFLPSRSALRRLAEPWS